ncbi:hypothetical protein QBC40DRAFT_185322 [Triangularia verruculosa]|uniref:Uncharacterized protein n=1 Tax=Triangularia verruculosa TaxID=2587418 RepID=A0AAN6X8W6_9PEZI|nr:hypothetical protein QBC40DRAFT_185322 [Triangularia verruculosa]
MTFIYPLVQALAQQRWNWYRNPRSLGDFRVFDEAPGGIWGSLSLMVTMRRSLLGVVTCLVLITSIMTSTLTQSAVSYPNHVVAAGENDSAIIAKSNGYSSDKNISSTDDLAFELQLVSSLLISPHQNYPSQPPSCITTNCTWPEFGTMEVCVNMTGKAARAHRWGYGLTHGTDVTHLLETGSSLPNGVDLRVNLTGIFGITAGVTTNLLNQTSIPIFRSLSFDGTDAQRTEVMTLYIWDDMLEIAYEVMLHYCINRYSVSMFENIPKTESISTTANSSFYYEGIDLVWWLNDPKEPESRYMIPVWSHNFVLNTLQQVFRRQSDRGDEVAQMVSRWMHIAKAKPIPLDSCPKSYHYDTVHNISRSIAAELTRYLLNPSAGNLTYVAGTAWRQEIWTSVRWEWLSLIVAQVVFSLVILLMVIIQTSELGLPVVKSSILPAFFAVGLADRETIEHEHYGRPLTPAAAKSSYTPEESYALLGELQRTKKGEWVLKSVYREA